MCGRTLFVAFARICAAITPSPLFASLLASTLAVLLLLFTGIEQFWYEFQNENLCLVFLYLLRFLNKSESDAKGLELGKLDQSTQIRNRSNHHERVYR